MSYLTVQSLQKRPELEQKLCSILTTGLLGFGGMHVERIATGRLTTVGVSRDIHIMRGPNIAAGPLEAKVRKDRQGWGPDNP